MLGQTVLPFKLEASNETLPAHTGLALLCRALGLVKSLDQALPAPGRDAGYAASSHALLLVLMLDG